METKEIKLAHSYSAIKLFENCALRYYRQRIVKDIRDEPGEASIYGDRVHKALENRLKSGADLPDHLEFAEGYCQSIENLGERGLLEVEKELVIDENFNEVDWWHRDAWIRFKLDALVVVGATALVFDWKTGKRRADTFQMEMFAAIVFQLYPQVQVVKTNLVWLKDKSMDTEVFKRKQAPYLWRNITAKISRIVKAYETENWPAKPSGLCGWCPARFSCDYNIS